MGLKDTLRYSAADSLNYLSAAKQLIDTFTQPNQMDLLREQIDSQERIADKAADRQIALQENQQDFALKSMALQSTLNQIQTKSSKLDELELNFAKEYGPLTDYGISTTSQDFQGIVNKVLSKEYNDIGQANIEATNLLKSLETSEQNILNVMGFRTKVGKDALTYSESMYSPQYQIDEKPGLDKEDFRLAGIAELMSLVELNADGKTYSINPESATFDMYPELKGWLKGTEGKRFIQELENYKDAGAPFWQVRESVTSLMNAGANAKNAEERYTKALNNLQLETAIVQTNQNIESLKATTFTKNLELLDKGVKTLETNVINPQKVRYTQNLQNSIRIDVMGENLSWDEAVAKMIANKDPNMTIEFKKQLLSVMSGAAAGLTNTNTQYISNDASMILGALQDYSKLPEESTRKHDALNPIADVINDVRGDLEEVYKVRAMIEGATGDPIEYMGQYWETDGASADSITIGGNSYTLDKTGLAEYIRHKEGVTLIRLKGLKNLGIGDAEDLDGAEKIMILNESQNNINNLLAEAYFDAGGDFDNEARESAFKTLNIIDGEIALMSSNDDNFEQELLQKASISESILKADTKNPLNTSTVNRLDAEGLDDYGFVIKDNIITGTDWKLGSKDYNLVKGMSHRFSDTYSINLSAVRASGPSSDGGYRIIHPLDIVGTRNPGNNSFAVFPFTNDDTAGDDKMGPKSGPNKTHVPYTHQMKNIVKPSAKTMNEAEMYAAYLRGFSGFIAKAHKDMPSGVAHRISKAKKLSHEAPDDVTIEQDINGNWHLFENDAAAWSNNNNYRIKTDRQGKPYITSYWIQGNKKIYLDDYMMLWQEIEMSRWSRRNIGDSIFDDGVLKDLAP